LNTKLNNVQNWQELAPKANWTVAGLAKERNISTRTLELFFLKHFKQTPKNWMADERQKRAFRLLVDGSSVKETAAELGYKHTQHFSRDFKKHWGYCPTKSAKC
jgi:transcriptional regulator GlxA family with amidase domain